GRAGTWACAALSGSGGAGEVHDPIGLPGLAAVVGEGLAPARRGRVARLPQECHPHGPAGVGIVALEAADATLEAPMDRRLQAPGRAGHPVDRPAPGLD